MASNRMRWTALTLVLMFGVAASRVDGATMPKHLPRIDPALPPIEAVLLPAPSQAAAEILAQRLGFATLMAAGNAWTLTARLGNAALVWYDPATHLRFGLAQPTDVAPVVAHQAPMRPTTLPVAFWEDVPASAMPHPNGATTLIGITAVTDDLKRTCDSWWKTSESGTSPFGPATTESRIGARSRFCYVLGPHGRFMTVRVIQPTDRTGLAARLLSNGGPRWVGVTVGVKDVADEARRLARAGIRASLVETPTCPLVWVDPRDAGGALIEFVPERASIVRRRDGR
jgi:hypothetical protein